MILYFIYCEHFCIHYTSHIYLYIFYRLRELNYPVQAAMTVILTETSTPFRRIFRNPAQTRQTQNLNLQWLSSTTCSFSLPVSAPPWVILTTNLPSCRVNRRVSLYSSQLTTIYLPNYNTFNVYQCIMIDDYNFKTHNIYYTLRIYPWDV